MDRANKQFHNTFLQKVTKETKKKGQSEKLGCLLCPRHTDARRVWSTRWNIGELVSASVDETDAD